MNGDAFGAQAPAAVHSAIAYEAQSGHGYTIIKRTDIYTHEIVATICVSGRGIRSNVAVEAVCRAFDDELATRSQS